GIDEGEEMTRLQALLEKFLDIGMTPALYAASMAFDVRRVRPFILRWGETRSHGIAARAKRLLFPWHTLADCRAAIDRILFAEIARCRQQESGARKDILAMLVAARDEQGEPMTDEELRDELLTLLVAGHETTATTLSWALYHILRAEGVEAKIRAELEQVFSGGPVDPSKMEQLCYLKAVINETLRL